MNKTDKRVEEKIDPSFNNYKNDIITKIFSKRTFYFKDLLNDILCLINNEKKEEKIISNLEYFLRGNYEDSTIEEKGLKNENVFLGIIGEYHKKEKLKEEYNKMKERSKKVKERSKEIKEKLNEIEEKLNEIEENIISRLDEKGSLKEIFHLNECNANEGFSPEEVKKIDNYVNNYIREIS